MPDITSSEITSALTHSVATACRAYGMPGARLVGDGIPVWQRAVLVNDDELAGGMADALGDRPVVLLRGHGLVSVVTGGPEKDAAVIVGVVGLGPTSGG